jgi:transcriptional regulator with XRE-family HTH domain
MENSFGEKLKGLRAKAGLTQESLAKELAVSRTLITKWETERRGDERAVVVHARRLRGRHRDRLIGRFGDPAPRAVEKEKKRLIVSDLGSQWDKSSRLRDLWSKNWGRFKIKFRQLNARVFFGTTKDSELASP